MVGGARYLTDVPNRPSSTGRWCSYGYKRGGILYGSALPLAVFCSRRQEYLSSILDPQTATSESPPNVVGSEYFCKLRQTRTNLFRMGKRSRNL